MAYSTTVPVFSYTFFLHIDVRVVRYATVPFTVHVQGWFTHFTPL